MDSIDFRDMFFFFDFLIGVCLMNANSFSNFYVVKPDDVIQ